MKANLIGVQNMKSIKMRDGTVIDGVKLHIAYPKEKVVGSCVESKFISRDVFKSFGVSVEDLENMAAEGVEVIDIEFGPDKHIVGIKL